MSRVHDERLGIITRAHLTKIMHLFPFSFCFSIQGAITGAILGQICAVIGWLVSAQALEGEITVASTGANYPMLTGVRL